MGDKAIAAKIGDLVMSPGRVRGIVIAVRDTFVTVLAIGTDKKTGDTFVLKPTFIHEYPASECIYPERQLLNW